MKKTDSIVAVICCLAVGALVAFFFEKYTLFYILSAVPAISIISLAVSSLIALKGEKIPKSFIDNTLMCLACMGVSILFTKNVLQIILLGLSLYFLVGLLVHFMWRTISAKNPQKPVDKQEEKKEPEKSEPRKIDADSLTVDTFTLGEVFPWTEYVYPGDHVQAVLKYESFDVVASFTDLTEEEETAVAESAGKASLFVLENTPYIIINFADIVRLQFSINMQKMKKEVRDGWFKSPSRTVTVYLLESNDGTLRAIRTFNIGFISVLKDKLRAQLTMDKDQIDRSIHMGESFYDVRQMESLAQHSSVIHEPGIQL